MLSSPRIVCAANRTRFTGEVVIGVRHYDSFMLRYYKDNCVMGDPVDQGFIDQYGVFYTRTEAWKIAETNGQIINRCGGDTANGGTLFSENLY